MTKGTKPKRPAPLSLRLTDSEREVLERRAGGSALSAYIKIVLFGETGASAGSRQRRVSVDQTLLAQVLAYLGMSQLSSSLVRLSNAATNGSLLVDERTQRRLDDACGDVRAMHRLLLRALGFQVAEPEADGERLTVAFQRAAFDTEDAP